MASFYQFELRGHRIAADFHSAERPVELWFVLELGFKSGGHAISGLNFLHPAKASWIALARDLTPEEVRKMGQLVTYTQPFSLPESKLPFQGRHSALQLRIRNDVGSMVRDCAFDSLAGIAPGFNPLRELAVSMVELLEYHLPSSILQDILAAVRDHP